MNRIPLLSLPRKSFALPAPPYLGNIPKKKNFSASLKGLLSEGTQRHRKTEKAGNNQGETERGRGWSKRW